MKLLLSDLGTRAGAKERGNNVSFRTKWTLLRGRLSPAGDAT